MSIPTTTVAGLQNTNFVSLVRVTNGVPIVAERATYWPLNTGDPIYGMAAVPKGLTPNGVTSDTDAGAQATQTPSHRIDPYAAETVHGTPPRLYQRLVGYPSGGATGAETDPDVGPPGGLMLSPAAITERAVSGALIGATTQSLTVTWFGAHLTGGRRR